MIPMHANRPNIRGMTGPRREPMWVVLGWLVVTIAVPAQGQIHMQPLELRSSDGPIRGYLARVELTDPRVEVVVTDPLPDSDGQAPEARLMRTDIWAHREAVDLAVNANFFATLDALGADIIGLSVSDGRVVSPARRYEGRPDWSIVFPHDGGAMIANVIEPEQIENAVSGVGASTSAPDFGGPLVHAGRNVAERARVDPLTRHPRTAVGLDATGQCLFIVVIDGRQPDWSVGITLPELAEIFIRHGATDAINLDGGGSTSLIYRKDEHTLTNRPSDGDFRPVANHLGIRLAPDDDNPPTR